MPTFKRSLPMMLNYTLDSIMPVHRELFARFGVTEQQWRVLRILWNCQKATMIEMSKQSLLPNPSLVGIIDRLTKKGLVSRQRSETDRRKVFIVATEAGLHLQKEVKPLVEQIQTKLKATVTKDEWQQLEGTLAKIREQMQQVSLNDILADE